MNRTIFFGFLIIVLLILAMRFLVGGGEDNWICVDGQWVKHGQPSAPQPTGICEVKR